MLAQMIRDNLYTIVTGRFRPGVTDLNLLGNLALMRLDRRTVTPSPNKYPPLTGQQKRDIQAAYRPYIRFLSSRYHRLYTGASGGHFDPAYVPEDLFFIDIDRSLSDREESRYLDNKCYYYRLLSNVKQPALVVMRNGKCWLDKDLKLISRERVKELVAAQPEVVVKRAVCSEGGAGVSFLSGASIGEDFEALMKTIPCDVVVQQPVKQHASFAALNKGSVNTIRLVSVLYPEEVKIYGMILRIGAGESRVDNSSQGGVITGLTEDGALGSFGAMHDGRIVKTHPDHGYAFEGLKVEHVDRAMELVREAHSFLGHFRIAAWDVTVDEAGEAVLIEVNLSLGGINDMQVCTGPLFGEDTGRILAEVYGNRRKLNTLF